MVPYVYRGSNHDIVSEVASLLETHTFRGKDGGTIIIYRYHSMKLDSIASYPGSGAWVQVETGVYSNICIQCFSPFMCKPHNHFSKQPYTWRGSY